MKKIKFNASFNGRTINEIEAPRNSIVGNILNIAQNEFENPNINSVYFKGRQLDPNELFLNCIDNSSNTNLLFKNNLDKGQADLNNNNVISKNNKCMSLNNRGFNKFKVFIAISRNSLFFGQIIHLNLSDTYEKVLNKIKDLVKKELPPDAPKKFEVHIFLPGGIPFLESDLPLSSYFDELTVTKHCFYVVVTKELGEFINEEVKEPCNCLKFNKNMLSPLFESTTAGLTQISSFLGYVYHNGTNSELFVQVFAMISGFSPLVTNMFRLIQHEKLNVRNIIAITGPLHCIFGLILGEVENERVFEYVLTIITFVGLMDNPEVLNLRVLDCDNFDEDDRKLCNYLKATNQQNRVAFWQSNIDSKFNFRVSIVESPRREVLIDYEIYVITTYKPVSPLSLQYIHHPTFIHGENENEVLLFIGQDYDDNEGMVKIIDPKIGEIEKISIIDLSIKLNNHQIEKITSVINQQIVKQIVVICFDESLSMRTNLGNSELSKIQLATQFLSNFIDKSSKLRDSSIYGLIGFSDSIKICKEVTSISSQFVEELNNGNPNRKDTLIYDALNKAQDMIIKADNYNYEEEEEEEDREYEYLFQNAEYRIILITDGEDNKSALSIPSLANDFISKRIIVDTILVSELHESNKEICAFSKMTGGLCFNLTDINEGFKIVDQEAFIDISRRFCNQPFRDEVTEKILKEEASKFNAFDKEAISKELLLSKDSFSLATPQYMNHLYKNKKKTLLMFRALKELNDIQSNHSSDIVVYSNVDTLDEWRIFIKITGQSSFENKWLNCFMNLPSMYPYVPPSFTFLTIPFHPNISCNGNVMFNLLDKDYNPELSIGSLIEEIVKILRNPEEDSVINREAYKLFIDDRNAFIEKQRRSEIGKSDYKEFIEGVKIFDQVLD